jgi:hypothetical protein
MNPGSSFAALEQQITQLAPVAGVTPVDVLQLPDEMGGPLRRMMRGGMTAEELAAEMELSLAEGETLMRLLAEKGYLRPAGPGDDGPRRYTVNFAPMRPRKIPLDL